MTTFTTSQPELVAELLEYRAELGRIVCEVKRLGDWSADLQARIESPQISTKKHVRLTFGKNFISWDGGTLVIRGKGYGIVKALCEAEKMQMEEEMLDNRFWKGEVKHETFTEYIRWLAAKLNDAKFPYLLLPLEIKGQVVQTETTRNGKPVKHYVDSVVIGARLTPR